MLQRIYRLPAKVRLIRPQTRYTPFFIVRISPNTLTYSRYGFIVSKKIDKRAVVRNRLKRRFRAGVESMLGTIPSGQDYLFLLKKEALEQTTEILHEEIKKQLLTSS